MNEDKETNCCESTPVQMTRLWLKFFDEHISITRKFFTYIGVGVSAFGIGAGAAFVAYFIEHYLLR